MKELIIRDLSLCKKRILPYAALIGTIFSLAAMVLLSARFGNIAKYGAENARDIMEAVKPAGIYFGVVAVLSTEPLAALNSSDQISGWYMYLKASGKSSRSIVTQKYLELFLLFGLSFILGLVLNLLIAWLADAGAADIGSMTFGMGLAFCYMEYNMFLGFARKGKANELLQLVPMFIMVALLLAAGVLWGDEMEAKLGALMEHIASLKAFLYPLTILMIALVTAVCFFLSVFFFEKEKKIRCKEGVSE